MKWMQHDLTPATLVPGVEGGGQPHLLYTPNLKASNLTRKKK